MVEIVAPNRRGRPLGRRKDRVKEYMCERGATGGEGLDPAKGSVRIGGGRGSAGVATTLEDIPRGSETLEL